MTKYFTTDLPRPPVFGHLPFYSRNIRPVVLLVSDFAGVLSA